MLYGEKWSKSEVVKENQNTCKPILGFQTLQVRLQQELSVFLGSHNHIAGHCWEVWESKIEGKKNYCAIKIKLNWLNE